LINQAMTRQGMIGGAFDLRIDSKRPMLKIVRPDASLRSRLTRSRMATGDFHTPG